jgi:hypothetical protein
MPSSPPLLNFPVLTVETGRRAMPGIDGHAALHLNPLPNSQTDTICVCSRPTFSTTEGQGTKEANVWSWSCRFRKSASLNLSLGE